MKKHLRIVIAAVLVLACVGALLAFAACDEEKQQATIEAEYRQEFVFDGQVHNVVAKLNHDETELVYSPQQGYSEIGEHTIEITAVETENYYAPDPVTVKLIILDPSDVAREELTDKLASSTVFKTSENIGVDLGVDLAYDPKGEAEGWGYKLAVKGSIDLAAPDSTLFSISLTDTLKKEEVFSVVYDGAGDDIYIAYGDVKYKAENADLLEALVSEAPNADVTLGSYLSMIVGTLGADGECTVSEDGKTYTLDFDLKAMLKGTLGNILGGLLEGEDFAGIASAIYKLVGASDWNGFIEKLPEISGDIVVSFDDNDDLASLSLTNVNYKDKENEGVFSCSVSPFSISNNKVRVSLPQDKDSYSKGNLLNLNAEGVLSLTTNGKSYVDYKVEVLADLDILSLIKGANENTGKLYLRISHICNKDCGTYCSEKYEAGEGSILEVGYDPSVNAGSAYIVAGMRNLLGTKAMTAIAGGIGSLADGAIPEYTAITADIKGLLASAVGFPVEDTGEGSGETGSTDSSSNILSIVGGLLGSINASFGNGNVAKIDIDLAGLLTSLGADEGTIGTIGALFGDPDKEFAMDGLSLAITSVGAFNTDFGDFDMVNILTKVKDASVDSDKVFTSSGILGMGVSPGLAQSAKTWEIVNLSDSNVPKMYTQLDLSMLTVYEAQTQLIGNEVYFDVVTLDGTQREEVPAKVLGVSGIDWTKLGEPQNVELLVTLPQTIINTTVTDALKGTVDVYELFKTTVPVTITLATASDFELVMGENFKDSYTLLDSAATDHTAATVKFKKTVGEKTVDGSIAVTNTTDLSKYFWTPNSSTFSDYVTVNGTGIEKNVPIVVNPGTVTLTYEAFNQTFTKDITISDPYTEKTMEVDKDSATVGSSLTLNYTFTLKKADGTTDTVVAKSSSRLTISGMLGFPEGVTTTTSTSEEADVTISNTSFKYNTFVGTKGEESVQTEFYVNIFGTRFVQALTLNEKKTGYSVDDSLTVNGLTATIELTITNSYVGIGQDYTGLTVAVENSSTSTSLYPVRAENCTVTVTPEKVDLANDLKGDEVKITLTITADKAGKASFYVRLYNGEASTANRVINQYIGTVTFTDAAQA